MNTSVAIKTTAITWGAGTQASHTEKYNTAPGQQKTKEGPWVGSLWLFSFSRTQPGYPCFLILPGALAGPFLCLQLSSDIVAGNLQRVFKGKWLRRKRTLKFHTMSLCYMWQGWDFNTGPGVGWANLTSSTPSKSNGQKKHNCSAHNSEGIWRLKKKKSGFLQLKTRTTTTTKH